MHPFAIFLLIAATVVVQPLVDREILEPSVRNEVEHALAIAPPCAPVPAAGTAGAQVRETLPFATNGMSRTDIAIRLVSEQKSDGRWRVGTNDVTAAAVRLLRAL